MRERASLTAEAAAEAVVKASILRLDTLGIIGRFRQALADEMRIKPDLPQNLDALVCGLFDQTIGSLKTIANRAGASETSVSGSAPSEGSVTTPSDGAPSPTEPQPD
jgi:hypothetical protein